MTSPVASVTQGPALGTKKTHKAGRELTNQADGLKEEVKEIPGVPRASRSQAAGGLLLEP